MLGSSTWSLVAKVYMTFEKVDKKTVSQDHDVYSFVGLKIRMKSANFRQELF